MSDLQITYHVVPVKGGYLLKAARPLHTVVAITKDPSNKPEYNEFGQLTAYYRRVDIDVPGKPVLLGTMKCFNENSVPCFDWWKGPHYREVFCDGQKGFKPLLKLGKQAGAGESWLDGWIIVTDFVIRRTHYLLSHQAIQKYAGKSIRFDPGQFYHIAYN